MGKQCLTDLYSLDFPGGSQGGKKGTQWVETLVRLRKDLWKSFTAKVIKWESPLQFPEWT